MCEGKDFNIAQCLEVGCCHWNDWEFEDGKCFSNVGRGKCIKGKSFGNASAVGPIFQL